MRVITRGDLDGLASTVFLSLMNEVTDIRFAHPRDMQEGEVEVTADDIIVNLPYVAGCGMWFDHHSSEADRVDVQGDFEGKYGVAQSAARLNYEFYDSPDLRPFEEMLGYVDRVDSADLSVEDVTAPEGWVLLGYTCDPRSGLGRFQDYFHLLIDLVKKQTPIEEILAHAEVQKRVEALEDDQVRFSAFLVSNSVVDGNVIVTDLRDKRDAPTGNRFLVYTLFEDANVQARIFDGINNNTLVALGHSIFNRTCQTDVGELLAEYGGGGHRGAGTAQFPAAEAAPKLQAIIERLKEAG